MEGATQRADMESPFRHDAIAPRHLPILMGRKAQNQPRFEALRKAGLFAAAAWRCMAFSGALPTVLAPGWPPAAPAFLAARARFRASVALVLSV